MSIAALTADIVVLFNQQKVAVMAPAIAGMIAFHFLLLIFITFLVTANQRSSPGEPESRAQLRTGMAILLGLVALVTACVILWEAL